MRRIVYSALMGSYERVLEQPAANGARADFVLFTDTPDIPSNMGWNVVQVAPRFPGDPVRSARYLKAVGHPMLDGYDETLWIDNRVVLKPRLDALFEQLEGFDMALAKHSFRGELREEFSEVIASGYDDPRRVRRMYQFAADAGVDHDQTLWTGLILRRRNRKVAECMRSWMDLILLTSRRDQLSINVALTKFPLSVNMLTLDNVSSVYHEWVAPHTIDRNQRVQNWRAEQHSPLLRLGDMVRTTRHGRLVARGLSKLGLSLPTIPR